ncbi:MAG TPA: alpha-L-arabinofuranosidase C-terminal domain-containing protein, partial [Fimbriimonas sp.]|nr:alpha-L-arabinofuranosidase C-terminal domain-containing protein [Fimbriimonas sp.]
MISLLLTLSLAQSAPAIRITVDANAPTISVSKSLFGIFFEEINQAGEGGLYAELLCNRGLDDAARQGRRFGWKSIGEGTLSTTADDVLNRSRPYSLKIERLSDSRPFSVVNEGFWGIPVVTGQRYRLALWTKGDTSLDVSLADGEQTFASARLKTTQGWSRQEVILRANGSNSNAKLVLSPVAKGTVTLGYSSLMPVQDLPFRPDLLKKLKEIRPGFVRFPGGCFVEGDTLPQRWNWKDSLGPIEGRRGMPQILWGYSISNGLGYHEYLQLCETLGSEPMFVANVGMSHREVVPMTAMDAYVQDTLDAIEYANGPVTSTWGALRAKNGHPKPFNLKYVEIGNENGGAAYNERFKLFAEAIHQKHPEIVRIADLWGGLPTSAPYELIDEHYYSTPSWFWRNMNRYDSYSRSGPKVYVGEYAVTQGSGRGNLAGALGEAAFMTGMERNSDVVRLASYAPLFENVNNRQWNPNAILFDASQSYGTPSYWVQTMFGQNKVDRIVGHSFKAPKAEIEPMGGGIGLMTWRTDAEFKDLEVTVDGKKLSAPLAFEEPSGNWTIENGVIRQRTIEDNRRTRLAGFDTNGAKQVTMSLKARKLAGDEGFIILFETSPRRVIQWNLGGWGNTVHAFQLNDSRFG